MLILFLIGLCGYTWWQLRQTQAQVVRLQAELNASKRRAGHTVAGTIPANDWTDRAERHAALARAAAQRGDISTAQHELSLSADAARKAIAEPALRTEGQIKRMQALVKSAQTEAAALVRTGRQSLDSAQGTSHAP
ncbi:hypothetical protein [Capsulimonas corticalis]|uniref:hypothetical protein n=1 Tax=Capsulimonas corticalis TaxID=2219043 RepID=UPI000F64AA32|nr:hypothetical protein [Capsulimonas corticalis]